MRNSTLFFSLFVFETNAEKNIFFRRRISFSFVSCHCLFRVFLSTKSSFASLSCNPWLGRRKHGNSREGRKLSGCFWRMDRLNKRRLKSSCLVFLNCPMKKSTLTSIRDPLCGGRMNFFRVFSPFLTWSSRHARPRTHLYYLNSHLTIWQTAKHNHFLFKERLFTLTRSRWVDECFKERNNKLNKLGQLILDKISEIFNYILHQIN